VPSLPPPTRSLRARLALAAAAACVALLCVEGAFRVAGYGDPLASDDLVMTWEPGAPLVRDPEPGVLVSLRPGFTGAMVYRRATDGAVVHRVAVRTSSRGLRGPEIPPTAAPGTLRILLLGDSLTFGYGVAEEQAFPAVLGRDLATTRSVEVVNAGVPTWNLEQEVAWSERRGLDLSPDVVVLCYYLNDLDPPWYDPGADPVPADLPVRAPPWARREGGVRRVSFALNQVFRVLERRRLAREVATWGRLGPGQPDLLEAERRYWSADRARSLFLRLRGACEARGAVPTVALLPVFEPLPEGEARGLLDQVEASARAAGVGVLRLDDTVRDLSLFERSVLPGDPHPSAEAHRRLGEALAARISPLLPRAAALP